MLNINPEIVCNIIAKARILGIEDDLIMPGETSSPGDVDSSQILAEYKEDLTYVELKNLIDDLEPDQQVTIIAIMYVGRGDYDVDEFDIANEEAKKIAIENRADYLIAKPMLAEYLEEGLTRFGYACEI